MADLKKQNVNRLVPMTGNSIEALIFDMDGLLFDTETMAFDNWLRAGRAFGCDIPESLLMDCIGRDVKGSRYLFEKALGPDFPFDEIRALRIQYAEERIRKNGVPMKSGVRELFEWLSGAPLSKAVATSTGKERAAFLLKTAGLFDHFDAVVTGEEVEKGKPEPDIFLLAAQRLNAPPERCVVFEDSDSGIRAAHRAGMIPILVPDMKDPLEDVRVLARHVCGALVEARRIIRDMLMDGESVSGRDMEIRLRLDKHCIETEMRRQYHRAVSACFKAKGRRPDLEQQVEMLKTALETFDFPDLRRRYPGLSGGGALVVLGRSGGRTPRITINGAAVQTENDDPPTPKTEGQGS